MNAIVVDSGRVRLSLGDRKRTKQLGGRLERRWQWVAMRLVKFQYEKKWGKGEREVKWMKGGKELKKKRRRSWLSELIFHENMLVCVCLYLFICVRDVWYAWEDFLSPIRLNDAEVKITIGTQKRRKGRRPLHTYMHTLYMNYTRWTDVGPYFI